MLRLTLCIALAVAGAAFAQDGADPNAPAEMPAEPAGQAMAAEVVSVSGQVEVLRADSEAAGWTVLEAGASLEAVAVIRTGLAGEAVLRLPECGEVTIAPATKAALGEFVRAGTTSATVGLKYGRVRASVDAPAANAGMKIATPVGVAKSAGSAADVGFAVDSGLGAEVASGSWQVVTSDGSRTLCGGEFTSTGLVLPAMADLRSYDTFVGSERGLTEAELDFSRKYLLGMSVTDRKGVPGADDVTVMRRRVNVQAGAGTSGIAGGGGPTPPPGPFYP